MLVITARFCTWKSNLYVRVHKALVSYTTAKASEYASSHQVIPPTAVAEVGIDGQVLLLNIQDQHWQVLLDAE